MRTIITAARFFTGYKLKALSLVVFMTLGLGLIMCAVDCIYNSFNAFFDRPASYVFPRYFVSPKGGFDILSANYGISDIALKTEQKRSLEEKLGKDFELRDVAYAWALFQSRSNPNKRFFSLVVGLDFAELDGAFPYFKGRMTAERAAEYGASPLLMVDSWNAKRSKIAVGEEYTLLSSDYFKDYNGIKVKVKELVDTPMATDESLTLPIVYIDLKHLRRLFALPAGRELPLLITPRRSAHALSLEDGTDMARIRAATGRSGLHTYSVSTVSRSLADTFALYRGVAGYLGLILFVVMTAAVSANLSINFQNRRADFGLIKAFGCSDLRLLGFVLGENAVGLVLSLALALAVNLAIGAAVRPFKVLYNFTIIPTPSAPGVAAMLAAAVAICAISSIQPYRHLRRMDSVAIMREE
jgi:ABC-type lipoprotein release transport system permease subunit